MFSTLYHTNYVKMAINILSNENTYISLYCRNKIYLMKIHVFHSAVRRRPDLQLINSSLYHNEISKSVYLLRK